MKFRSKVERQKKFGVAKIVFGIGGIIFAFVNYNIGPVDNKLPSYMTDSISTEVDSALVFFRQFLVVSKSTVGC